jgi:MEMO1 family protein
VTGAVRPPALSGRFYPGRRERLWQDVHQLLADAARRAGSGHARPPKAIVVPHVAYVYSGPIAATAYAALAPARGVVRTVIVAGPAHFAPLPGVAVAGADAFLTPLGAVTVDDGARRRALEVPGVVVDDAAHAPEHSVEVQLPLVIAALGDVSVLPLLVGRAGGDVLADVLDELWDGAETSVVVSTDLSHYLDADAARVVDRRTADAICRLQEPDPDSACGAAAVAGMVVSARRHRLDVWLLDLRNSADTVGDPDRVVGYGSFALFEPPAGEG